MKTRRGAFPFAGLFAFAFIFRVVPVSAFDVVLSSQGEYLDAYFEEDGQMTRRVLVHPDDPSQVGRHLNGKLCFFPDSAGASYQGKFVIADDTYREACVETSSPQARCSEANVNSANYVGADPDGWGVFNNDASWAKRVIAVHDGWSCGPTSCVQPLGTVDPQGCAFDDEGNLFGNDVGQGEFGAASGTIVMFFQDSDYTEHCFVAKGLSSPGMPEYRDGALYFAQSGAGQITKLSGAFPATAADCELDTEGHPVPKDEFQPTVETILPVGSLTPIGLAAADHVLGLNAVPVRSWFLSSVLLPPMINEYLELGSLMVPVRSVALPFVPANPIGLDLGSDGTAYYAELSLTIPDLDTGCGRVSRAQQTSGVYLPPEVLAEGLRFPDGITVVDSSDLDVDWSSLPDAAPSNCSAE